MKNRTGSFTILTLLFLFSAVWADSLSSWPMFRADAEHSGRFPHSAALSPSNLWTTNLNIHISSRTSPITGWLNGEEVVYIGTDSGLACLSGFDGSIKWQYPTPNPIVYSPANCLDKIYFAAGDTFYCLTKAGERLWSYSIGPDGSQAVFSGRRLFVNSDSRLYCFDADSGVRWMTSELGPGFDNSAPAIDDSDNIYVTTLGNSLGNYDFRLYKFSFVGQQLWMKEELFWEPGGVRMTPVVRQNKIYFATTFSLGWSSSVYVYQNDRTLLRRITDDDGIGYISPILLSNGWLGYNTVGYTDALKVCDDSGPRWNYLADLGFSSPAVDSADNIIFGTTDGQLLILNQSGGVAYRLDSLGDSLISPALGSDGSIYIASQSGVVYKFGDVVVAQDEPKSARGLSGIKIYPNPFNQRLTIHSLSEVRIYSLDGRRVFTASRGSVVWRPVGLPNGVYLVKTNQQMIKVVKES